LPIARQLLKAGHTLVVHDIRPEAANALLATKAEWVELGEYGKVELGEYGKVWASSKCAGRIAPQLNLRRQGASIYRCPERDKSVPRTPNPQCLSPRLMRVRSGQREPAPFL
jgi:hypothetical protein